MTPKQQRFCEEYLVDLNATKAAIRAGYSEDTAGSQGQRMLKNVDIQFAISEAQERRSKRTQVTQDMVIQELARIGFSDLRSMMTDKGALTEPSDWDDATAAAISSIEVVTKPISGEEDEDGRKLVEHVHKIKVWDKNSALEKLARHLGMFNDKVQHSGDVAFKIVTGVPRSND